MLKAGDKVADFTLKDAGGKDLSLSDFRGKKVVVYFYPKDDTPGCTTEACGLRDVYDRILEKGAVVIGISADSTASHEKFRNKYKLPFHLLSDTDRKVEELFGAWSNGGLTRSTFILDGEGTVIKAWPKVTPAGHAEEVLAAL